MNGWTLPREVKLGGQRWAHRTDYREILTLLRWLTGQADPALDRGERWYVAMRVFYPAFGGMPPALWPAAAEYLGQFLAGARPAPARAAQPLMDWQQDAPLIAAGISRAAGRDVRELAYLHWWSFLALYDSIGEGAFATVVRIRAKLRRGRKLDEGEREFYRENRELVVLRKAEDPAAAREKEKLLRELEGVQSDGKDQL